MHRTYGSVRHRTTALKYVYNNLMLHSVLTIELLIHVTQIQCLQRMGGLSRASHICVYTLRYTI